MKKIKPEVIGYAIFNRSGDICPAHYMKWQLKDASEEIIDRNIKLLMQSNGKPKFRPVYKSS